MNEINKAGLSTRHLIKERIVKCDLDFLKFMVSRGTVFNEEEILSAVSTKNMDIIKFVMENKNIYEVSISFMRNDVPRIGNTPLHLNLEIVKYLTHGEGFHVFSHIFSASSVMLVYYINYCDYETLEYFYNDWPINKFILDLTIKTGDLDKIRFILEKYLLKNKLSENKLSENKLSENKLSENKLSDADIKKYALIEGDEDLYNYFCANMKLDFFDVKYAFDSGNYDLFYKLRNRYFKNSANRKATLGKLSKWYTFEKFSLWFKK